MSACYCKRKGCRLGRPLCRRTDSKRNRTCTCMNYHYPHRAGSGDSVWGGVVRALLLAALLAGCGANVQSLPPGCEFGSESVRAQLCAPEQSSVLQCADPETKNPGDCTGPARNDHVQLDGNVWCCP